MAIRSDQLQFGTADLGIRKDLEHPRNYGI